MKNEQTAVIKDMEFLLNELHKEWERPGEVKSSVSIPYEKVEEISRKLNVIVYETQQSADSDGLAFKQSIAKSKQCCHYGSPFFLVYNRREKHEPAHK